MSDEWSTTVADYHGVDDVPTAISNNLVKSGGVAGYVTASQNSQTEGIDLSVGQNDYNIATQSDLRNIQGIQYQKSLTVRVGNPNHNAIDVSFVNNVVDTISLSDIHGVNMSKLCFGHNDSSLNKTL